MEVRELSAFSFLFSSLVDTFLCRFAGSRKLEEIKVVLHEEKW